MYKNSLYRAAILVLIVVLATACGRRSEKAAQAPDASSASIPVSDHESGDAAEAVEAGLALYRSKGCGACHGENGEGDKGPALAGHTPEQVRLQVRTPQKTVQVSENAQEVPVVMPPFSEEMVSEAELDQIVAWVESLGPPTGDHDHAHGEHGEPMPEMAVEDGVEGAGMEGQDHLRLALFAVKGGDLEDGAQHLQDLIAVLGDGEMQQMAVLLQESLEKEADRHEAEHELEEMMAVLIPGADTSFSPQLYLQLAVDSLALDDVAGTQHHLRHYVDLASGMDKIKAREALELAAQGELHEADHAVEELMGMMPHAEH